MVSNSRFMRLVELCESQLTKQRLAPAIETAKTLVRLHPDEPKSWHLRHLLVCMSNTEGGAARGSNRIMVEAREHLGGLYTAELHADMLRDRGLALATFGTRAELNRIPELLEKIREAHAGDPNREAAAFDLEAHWYFARGNAHAAIQLHQMALDIWKSLGDLADQGWVANCKVRLLRASVKQYGRGDRSVYDMAKKLSKEHPDKARQAIILTGFCGLWIFDFALKHR